ncbi:MAG: sensor histidine kinase [Lachnospiraceae bacterium]
MTGMFLYIFAINLTGNVIDFVLMYYLCKSFGERTLTRKKMIGLIAGASMLLTLLFTLFTYRQIYQNSFFYISFGLLLFSLVITIIQAIILCQIFKVLNKGFVFFLITIISALSQLCADITENLNIYRNGIEVATTYLLKFLIRMPFLTATFILIYILIRLLKRTKLANIIKAMKTHPKQCIFLGLTLVMLKLFGLNIYSNVIVKFGQDYNYTIFLLFFAVIIVMIILIVHSYISELKRKEMKIVMEQQADYLNRLEEIQRKLRVINHDYKNVAAGLYLSAEAGDMAEVKSYVTNQLLNLDHEIQLEIRQMNQLINIKDIKVKSLIITKVADAAEKKVKIDIEISNFAGSINIPEGDKLRVLGILLDNAIEGAAEVKDKQVKVLITEENEIITILIKNRTEEEILLNQITKPGYSSKGEGRGLGLYSLKQLLKKYPNIFLETNLEDGWFIQIIKIT